MQKPDVTEEQFTSFDEAITLPDLSHLSTDDGEEETFPGYPGYPDQEDRFDPDDVDADCPVEPSGEEA